MSKTRTSSETEKDSSSMQAFVARILDRLSTSSLLSRRGATRRRNRESSIVEALETRALLAGVYESTVLADSPTAFWRLGEPNSATTIADISGNGLSGSRVGGTFGQAGALADDLNTSVRVSSGPAAQVADNNQLTPGVASTFEAWIKPDSIGSFEQVVFGKLNAASEFEYKLIVTSGGTFRFSAVYAAGTGGSLVSSTTPVVAGQWQHVAATVNSGTVRLYLNGVQVGQGSSGTFRNTSGQVLIGFSPGDTAPFQFQGQIDEVAFYQTALPQSRLLAHYQAGTNFIPTNVSLSSASVAENQPIGTTVGTLSTTDTSGNTHAYSLVSGAGDTDNASFEIVGNQLRTKSPFDFEAKSSYTVRVRTTDQGQLTFEKTFNINVTDRDEIPPTVTATSFLTTGALTANSTSLSVTFSEPVAFQYATAANPLGSATNPAYSAKHILTENPSAPSGIYWIDPNGGSPSDAFQVYCDMSTDGGGWMLAVNSVLGSEAATNLINANTGTVGLSTGHTRNLDYIATSQTAQIRHYIDARNVGRDIFHGKYTGTYTTMSSYEQMTRLPDSINSPYSLAMQFGRSLASTPYGSNWYYTGAFSSIPATPSNGNSGPAFDNNPANVINAYRIWVRETGSSGNGASSIPAVPASGAANPANYELRRAGADGLLGNADDPIVNVTSIVVNGNTAALGFSALPEDVYRLTVKDAIVDGAANALDGDSNGIAGGNWRRDFVVGALTSSLQSPGGLGFDPEFGGVGAGQLVNGPENAFDGTNRLEVAGTAFSASPSPTVNVSESFVNVPQVQISSVFANLSGLSTTIATSGGNVVRLSSAFNLYALPSSSWANVEVRFVVDGTPLPVAATILTPSVASGNPQVIPVLVEDYVPLAAGIRTITIQARQINDPGTGGAPSSFPIFVDDGAKASIRASEFLAVGSLAETFSHVPKAEITSSFANLNGLSTTITTSGANSARLSSAFNLFVFPTSSWANVEVRFVVDGTPLPVAATLLTPQLPSGSAPQVIPVVVEDYVTLAAGVRTITIQARQINDAGAGGAPSSFPIFVDSGPASSLRVIEFYSAGSLSESFANVPQAQIASSFATLSGLSTTITTSGSNPVRLSSSFNLYAAPSSSWANVEVRFVVDGVPLPVAATILTPQISSGNPQVIPVSLEAYATLAAGAHTIAIQARQINDPAAGGLPSNFPLFVDDGAASSIRAIEFLSQPAVSDAGRSISTNVQRISGLDVHRKVTVPSTGMADSARTVDVLVNNSVTDVTVPVRVFGNLGSDAATTVFATSDGDLLVEPTDLWFGTDDADGGGTPAIIHLLHGPYGLRPTSVNVVDDNVEWTYDLTIPAGETKRLAHFTVLGTTRAEAIAAANSLVMTNGFGGEAAAFLTTEELASLANFEFNSTPTDIALTNSSVAENAGSNAFVGTLSFSDPDPGDTATFSLPAGLGNNHLFNIAPDGTTLRANSSFNFEVQSSYSITVRVTDAGGLSFDKPFTISVTDVNEAPTAVSLQNVVSTRAENTDTSSRIRVADILVTDDAPGSNSFSLSGADAASFEIDGTQLFLKAGTTLDFETKSSFSVTVEVNDATVGITPDATVDYLLSVLNVNEAPVLSAIESSPLLYVENDAPKLVTQTLVVQNDIGPNIAWARVVVQQVAGGVYSPDDVLTVDVGDSGLTATFNVVLPGYLELTGSATAATYQTVLRTVRYFNTSDSPSAGTRRVAFFVSDGIVSNVENRYFTPMPVNDAPTGTNLNLSQAYTEDTALPLTAIHVSDADSTDVTASLTLSDAEAGILNEGSSGRVVSTFNAGVWTASGAIADVNALLAGLTFTPTLNSNLNFTIAVSISDQTAPAVTGLRSMTVIPVNDAPTIVSPSSAVVAENQTAAIDVNAADVDAGTTLLYSLSGPDSELFQIDSVTGVAGFKAAPDFEVPADVGADNIYNLTVTVSDGSLTATQAIAITVTDVVEDVTAPVTRITALPAASTSRTINIAVTGNDPGAGASGVLEYELYVSSGGAFTKFATVPAGSPTTTFTGSASTTYWFRSLGRDNAGNVETKTTSDTFTRIGDVVPPSTNVTSAVPTSNGLFTVQVTGTKIGGTPLTVFDVYVSIDGNTPLLAGTTSSLSLGGGNYSGQIQFQGLLDSTSHTYRFFSRGRDSAGNVEPAPASGDVSVTYSFASAALTATAIDVQNGVNQRSYVRYLDVLFSSSTGLSNLLSTDHVKVERYGIDATILDPGMGTQVNGFTLSQQGNRLRLDFGANGLGGLRQAGNGFYRVYLDLDLTAAFHDIPDRSFEFHRLFGDATGDGKVDVADTNLVTSQIGRTGLNLDGDLDGNGSVNSTDRLFTTQQRGRKLLDDMLGFLDD